MATRWDAARDQQLFLLMVDCIKVDYKVVAQKWAERYPDDNSKPSASAIAQHIYKLQKANGGGSGGSKPKATFKPTTPSSTKRTVPKTPSSSAKRQKTRNMSDEDDSEEEKPTDFSTITKRESSARRSKTNRAAYVEPSSDEEDGASDILTSARTASRSVNRLNHEPTFTSNGGYASPLSKGNSVSADDDEVTVTASRSVGKKPMSNFDYFNRAAEDSDASDYQPLV